jgi:hypothetical protein
MTGHEIMVLPFLTVRPQSAVLSQHTNTDDPGNDDHEICAACREMELVDLPPGSLLETGEELKNEAIGITLLIDHNRRLIGQRLDNAYRLCGLLYDTWYTTKVGRFPLQYNNQN